jgi:hypothetical protein
MMSVVPFAQGIVAAGSQERGVAMSVNHDGSAVQLFSVGHG